MASSLAHAFFVAMLVLTQGSLQAAKVPNSTVIRIGYLSGLNTDARSGAAVSLAIEQFQREGRLSNHTFEVVWQTGGCSAEDGVAGALRLHEQNVDVIIGPFCSTVCIPAGYMLRYWNRLFLPERCRSPLLKDKTIFNTLVRISPGIDRIGRVMVDLLIYFGWHNVLIWNSESGTCKFGADSMEPAFLDSGNITLRERIRVYSKLPEDPIPQEQIIEGLKRIQERGRIVLLCFEGANMATVMQTAAERGMVGPDYVYIWYSGHPTHLTDRPWLPLANQLDPGQLDRFKENFYAMKLVHLSLPESEHRALYFETLTARASEPPWNIANLTNSSWENWVLYTFDATILYLTLLEEALAAGRDYRDGHYMARKAKRRVMFGVSGRVYIGNEYDREPDYVIRQFRPGEDRFTMMGDIGMNENDEESLVLVESPYWRTPGNIPPPDIPLCGLRNDLCPGGIADSVLILVSVLAGFAIILFAGMLYWFRRVKHEKELHKKSWQVSFKELRFQHKGSMAMMMSARSLAHQGSAKGNSPASPDGSIDHVSQRIAMYRGKRVYVTPYTIDVLELTRRDLIEMKWMSRMCHDNLVQFVGACVTPPNFCVVTVYCSKGTLEDILSNDDIKLDWIFKKSFISDLAKGMRYIHSSPFVSHGSLSSGNCIMDSRWVLKIADYGLGAFKTAKSQASESEYTRNRDELWTAPELLRKQRRPLYGTRSSDVYSFAIVLQEIIYRALPFFHGDINPAEVVCRVKAGEDPPYRPQLPKDEPVDKAVQDLIVRCWHETPEMRPSFSDINRQLLRFNSFKNLDIMDAMFDKLERYASNLEEIVAKRTSELTEEKKKTDVLLYRMLPQTVAEMLKTGKTVSPEMFSAVTIYFSDIVGFTTLAAESTPMEVVDLLNDLYTSFDKTIDQHDVYKVETIGDAYMVVSGLPNRTTRHAANIADMALDLLAEVRHFRVRHLPERRLLLRIGLHTGPCAAGVVGYVMPRYCLFGDTVNVASRMESNGEASKIHISEQMRNALIPYATYQMKERGQVDLKGKGYNTTYWLEGCNDTIET